MITSVRPVNVAALVLATAIAFAPSPGPGAAPASDSMNDVGDISGRITLCGAPATGVVVYAPGTSFDARTDAAGRFRISYAKMGTYDLTIDLSDVRLGGVEQVTVKKRSTTDIGTVDICASHRPGAEPPADIASDNDGDGYDARADCDDASADVHPGAVEACGDNIDNNCNGATDEGCTSCTDKDADGYFVEATCGRKTDCNDSDSDVNPGMVDVCDDVDNDCDTFVDEDCGL